MNKKYLIYGIGVLVFCLLMYVYFDSLKVYNVYSKKIESSLDKEMYVKNRAKYNICNREDSIGYEWLDRDINMWKEYIKYDKPSAVESEESKENPSRDNEFSEEEVLEEDKKEDEKYEVVEAFDTMLSSDFTTNIKYEKYSINFSYLVMLEKSVNIREEPSSETKILREALRNEKINLSKAVKGQYVEKYDSDLWYKVYWEDKGETKNGYMIDKLGETRSFRINEMLKFLDKLKTEVDSEKTAYISNYKNASGSAPLYKGKEVDKYGIRRYQSAPAYMSPDYESEFRYLRDGILLSILEEKDKFFKVRTLNFKGEYWVPKKFVSFENSIEELKKVVVVDRKNQNEAVFEYSEDKWSLVSYGLATTGRKGSYRMETPLGYYMVIEKRPSFVYYSDGTNKIAGYAPYVTRFTGGIYIHGIPTSFKYVEGKRINPGASETSSTIGTIPLSHGCVRNNTSHAKFLYDWIDIGKSAIIVIDELLPDEFSGFKNKKATLKKF